MAIEKPLSMEFIKDHFPATYTITPPISFRTINSTLSKSTPDSFVDFDGNQLTRFTYVSGADGGAISGDGDLFSTVSQFDFAQFQDTCASGGTNAYVYVNWTNTSHYSNLVPNYEVRVYLGYFSLASGTFTAGNVFLENYNSVYGFWSTYVVLGTTPSVNYSSITTSSQWAQVSNQWRIRIQNYSSSGSCTLNLGVGVRIIAI